MESSSSSSSLTLQIHAVKHDEENTNYKRGRNWSHSLEDFYQYRGFWFSKEELDNILSAQQHYKARSTDIILASFMKTGTTWLKALAVAIVTRATCSPLLNKGPHDCMPSLEIELAKEHSGNIQKATSPLVATHLPYACLPKSVADSDSACKIVYIWRDPKDVFISMWFFIVKLLKTSVGVEPVPIKEAFELFCNGIINYGPYWDHVLGYWKAKQESPDRVLFLKYEDLKTDTNFYVKKLAEFMDCPFTLEEEEKGAVEKIISMCSFENLSNLEVNKNGLLGENKTPLVVKNDIFFRKGEVGDWKNHLTPEMGARLDEIMEKHLLGSGLTIVSP